MSEQERDTEIALAFNAGYLMQKYEPELLKNMLTDANRQNELVNSMALGQRQFKKERLIQQHQAAKKHDPNKKPNRGR